jgi:hypothetical protein
MLRVISGFLAQILSHARKLGPHQLHKNTPSGQRFFLKVSVRTTVSFK